MVLDYRTTLQRDAAERVRLGAMARAIAAGKPWYTATAEPEPASRQIEAPFGIHSRGGYRDVNTHDRQKFYASLQQQNPAAPTCESAFSN